MTFLKTILRVGAEKPFCALHLSDTHLTFADERDDDRKRSLASERSKISEFSEACEVLQEAENLSKKEKLPIFHTGDLIDFVSHANLDFAARYAKENDLFIAAGNHEFSQYVGEAREDAAYRNQSLPRVQNAFRNDIRFSSSVINGVNFVAIDNSYYLFEEEQLERLKAEVAKGMPVVLLLHTPLYEERLYDFHRDLQGDAPVYEMNVPLEKMAYYSPERFRQQRADEITKRAYDYVTSAPSIKAILCGHVHHDFESAIAGKLPQIVTGCSTIRRIEFI